MRGQHHQKPSQVEQNQMIAELQKAIVPLSQKQGQCLLEVNKWNVQNAANYYLEMKNNSYKLDKQFNKYASTDDPNYMSQEGCEQFFVDIGLDLMDKLTLYISWKFNAEKMGVFSRSEFLLGMNHMKKPSIEDLQRSIGDLRKDYQSKEVQKHVYRFVFDFAKTGKDMTFQYARALWESLLKDQLLIVKLLEYLDTIKEEQQKPITRDTWYMVWEFQAQIKQDLSNYDYQNGAWPTFLDEFYYYTFPQHRPK